MVFESAHGSPSNLTSHRGFTLLELLVTVAIAAILAALAAPSLRDFIGRSKMTGIGSEFAGSVLRARNEAVSKNICVTMCMSTTVDATGVGTQGPKCATSGQDWQVGWIAFINPTCDSSVNFPDATTPENMLFVRRSVGNDFYLQAQAQTRKMQFTPRGISGLGSAQEFRLIYKDVSDPWTEKFGYYICLNKMGRTRTVSQDSSCGSDVN